MFNISSYLEKFVRLGLKKEETKEKVRKILLDITGKNIPLEFIEYKKNNIEIRDSSTYKNLLFIKKNLILEKFREAGIRVVDIR